MPEDNDFATTGTESYKLSPDSKKKEDRIVLKIEEEKPRGVVLDQKAKELETGNFFIDTFRKLNRFFVLRSKVKVQAKAQFFHLLAVMINSGVPMIKALRALAPQSYKSPRLQTIIEEIAEAIEAGASLSESMLNYSDVFTEKEIGMIQSGEASGQLNKVLENLSQDLEKIYNITRKVKSAMTYPIVIFLLLIAVVVVMMVYVVPKLTELFTAVGQDLPLITKIVIGISDFMVNYRLGLSVGVLGFVLLLLIARKTELGRIIIDNFKIKIPIFGNLFKQSYLARLARSLSNLLDSKLSIVRTMEITANSMGNEVYRKRLLIATEDIKQGIPLAESLASSDLFPPMLTNMIEVGEQTAQLDAISAKVAAFYENEVDTTVEGISKIIEPVILILIGGTVAVVVASIMLPIMKLSESAGAL